MVHNLDVQDVSCWGALQIKTNLINMKFTIKNWVMGLGPSAQKVGAQAPL